MDRNPDRNSRFSRSSGFSVVALHMSMVFAGGIGRGGWVMFRGGVRGWGEGGARGGVGRRRWGG
jgi:hypothetical protein